MKCDIDMRLGGDRISTNFHGNRDTRHLSMGLINHRYINPWSSVNRVRDIPTSNPDSIQFGSANRTLVEIGFKDYLLPRRGMFEKSMGDNA